MSDPDDTEGRRLYHARANAEANAQLAYATRKVKLKGGASDMADHAYLERLQKELANSGKLLEAGWVALRLACIPDDAPKVQLDEMRMAFFAGAQHLFSSIMHSLDPGAEPTDADLNRMDLIEKELQAFIAEFELRQLKTKGRA
jgi:hypothetical protein